MENSYFFDMFCNKIEIFRSITSTDNIVIKNSRIFYNSNILILPNIYNKKKLKKLVELFITTKFNSKNITNLEKIKYFLKKIK